MVKGWLVVAVPALVVNWITPVTAALGTVARTSAGLEKATNAGRRAPSDPAKVTDGSVAPTFKLDPVRVTSVPTGPLFGLKSAMTGGCAAPVTVKVTLLDVPPEVSTVTGPVAAEGGTTALISPAVAER